MDKGRGSTPWSKADLRRDRYSHLSTWCGLPSLASVVRFFFFFLVFFFGDGGGF
jgi:hypothetical protein